MKLYLLHRPFLLTLFVSGLLAGCSTSKKLHEEPLEGPILFRLEVSQASLDKGQARIQITVPGKVKRFEAPPHYGGGPMFLQYVSEVEAKDSNGKNLPVKVEKNIIETDPEDQPYTLSYLYSVPQKISGEIHLEIPTLSQKDGRFDDNVTFVNPQGVSEEPAKLVISAPDSWVVMTGWGIGREFFVPKVWQLISGMIVLGGYNYSSLDIGGTPVHFAIKGDFPHKILKRDFVKILAAQQETVGRLSMDSFLVVLQSAKTKTLKERR